VALGYEGVIEIGTHFALGTGSSVPRARVRLESGSGYGGRIKIPVSEIGIGAPHNYDWSQHDGSLNFEVSQELLTTELKTWLFNRQLGKGIVLSSRKNNSQIYQKCYWNSISLSASEGAAVDGSLGFVGLEQDTYTWGDKYIANKKGAGLLCPLDAGMPPPLNKGWENKNPVPFWNTKVYVKPAGGSSTKYNFTTWSLDYSQEIVKFFGCTRTSVGVDPGAQEPLFIAAGPMSVIFTGSFILDFDTTPTGYFGDNLDELIVHVGSETLTMKRLEVTSESDDVQSGESLVPLTVEYAAYEIAA